MNFCNRILLFILILLPALSFSQQSFPLYLRIIDSDVGVLTENKIFSDTILRRQHVSRQIQAYQSQGYIFAKTILLKDSVNKLFVDIQIGQQFRWGVLKFSTKTLQVLESFESNVLQLKGQLIDPGKLQNLMTEILNYTENNGYPLASLNFDSIEINNKSVNANINLTLGELVVIDSVTATNANIINPIYLASYIGLKNGTVYRQNKIDQIYDRVNQLDFLTLKYLPIIIRNGSMNVLKIAVENKNSNQLEGLIGLVPSNNGKANFIGQFHLNLKNIFKRGEKIDFDFKGQPNNTRDLNFKFNYDYLFGSFISSEFIFSIRRQDTSFVTLNQTVAFPYYFAKKNYIKFFYKASQSNLISNNTNQNLQILPVFSDVASNHYGLALRLINHDNQFYSTKGLQLDASIAFGNRTIYKNTQFDPRLYDSIKLVAVQMQAQVLASGYFQLAPRNVIYTMIHAQSIVGNNLFQNELIRYGGLKSLRGFNEESLNASNLGILTLEYRFLLDDKTFIQAFFDQAVAKSQASANTKTIKPYGFGLGLNLLTKAGVFSICYAVGKSSSVPIQFNNAKIHFGIVNNF
jgi:outer membrane protein assembly factor BamA